MTGSRQQADVVVIGGGLAGLTAAVYAARAGHSVALFESGEVGGRAATLDAQGYRLNQGPHALYKAGAAAAILRELGVSYTGGAAAAQRYAWYEGKLHSFPSSPASLLTTSLFGLADKADAGSVLAALRVADPEALRALSVREWLDRTVKSLRVRLYLEALIRLSTFVSAPEQLSAGAALAQLQLGAEAGVTYVDGGWQSLVDGLVAVARDAGVRFFPGERVERILVDGAVGGIRLADGTVWEARGVVAAVRPNVAAALVGEDAAPELIRWASEAIPVRLACLDLGLSRLPRPDRPFALGLDTPLYLSVHSVGARLAPEGGTLLHVAKYLGSEPPSNSCAVEQELEAWLDVLQPGWRDAVVTRRYLPNMIVSNALRRADRGGGLPGPEVPDVPGLWVAGDWVGGTGMLADAAVASGRRAGELAAAAVAGVERRRAGVQV